MKSEDKFGFLFLGIILLAFIIGISIKFGNTREQTNAQHPSKQVQEQPKEEIQIKDPYWKEIDHVETYGDKSISTYTNNEGKMIVVVTGNHQTGGTAITQIK
jgi:hypothetical protein